jgi:hypothetical protein
LHSDAAGGRHDAIVLDSQIICRRAGANGGDNRRNRRRSSSGRRGCAAAGQKPISGVFRSGRRCSRADVSASRAADQVQVLNGVIIGVIVAASCQGDADHLTKSCGVNRRILNGKIAIDPRRVRVITVNCHVAGAIELNHTQTAGRVTAYRNPVGDGAN